MKISHPCAIAKGRIAIDEMCLRQCIAYAPDKFYVSTSRDRLSSRVQPLEFEAPGQSAGTQRYYPQPAVHIHVLGRIAIVDLDHGERMLLTT